MKYDTLGVIAPGLFRANFKVKFQTASKSSGPLWSYTRMPMEARGCLFINLPICLSISLDPSFWGGGKGVLGTGTPRNL